MNNIDLSQLPSTFYRVTAKALIKDKQDRLLVIQNGHGHDEIPGGGMDFGETFEACLSREVSEELSVTLKKINNIVCIYHGRNHNSGIATVRIAAFVEVDSHKFVPSDGMVSFRFVTKEEFLSLDMSCEGNVQDFADTIWKEN